MAHAERKRRHNSNVPRGLLAMGKHTPECGTSTQCRTATCELSCSCWCHCLQIPFAPNYEAMNDGRVFSRYNWRGYGRRQVTPIPNDDGYPSVRLSVGGKRRHFAVHKIVAALFLRKRPSPIHEIRHVDGDKQNNRWWNLEWGTKKDNADDRERHGRTSRGESHALAIKAGLAACR